MRFSSSAAAALALLCSASAQAQTPVIELSLLSDPTFQLLSGEVIVSQQLGSWGIKLGPIFVGLSLDLGGLGLGLKKRDERRSRVAPEQSGSASPSSTASPTEERRLLGLDLGLLNLGLNFGGPSTSSHSQSKDKALINLDLGLDLSDLFAWGNADDVARGERGDTEWFTYISVGSPPQSIPVLPDTGSADLFIFGPTCSSCHLYNHTSFNPFMSTTYTNMSAPWEYYYADGSAARGYTSTDLISFGSGGRGDGKATQGVGMTFAVATDVGGSDFKDSLRSGVMGLGLDPMSTFSTSSPSSEGLTLFSKLVKSKALYENMLSMRFVKGQQSQGVFQSEGEGKYVFGGIEENYVLGGRAGILWADVISANYWGFTMDDILVGSRSVLAQDTRTPRRAIIDTGTTLIITSYSASAAIHSQIQSSRQDQSTGIWYIPCITAYPITGNVFFSIGGRKFGVPVEDLAWKRSAVLQGMCISGVQGGMDSFTVLGDMFIKNHYVVLSYGQSGDKPQVGLADRTDVVPIL
ncbi:hypothetical protein I317_01026 [Kwoniella heveanensis CBS 569]|uniref:Peptidase A1 domain-containing protein n=1 Tax=Kwoniella heveanensis BCC8398 TaxID=1296120 RepID=A0A1B9GYN5_9TREE|nr:hypothetical protein I316_02009 [Kwoniella heveanensis BCC8398]OCF45223.1 hypothetical protein I317_01026 [Kwoniella heveanensis CBS 569]